MFHLKLNAWVAFAVAVVATPTMAYAQSVYSYQLIPRTVYEKKPVTVTRWVDETVMEKQQVTSYKPVWEKEPRERRQVTYKPVQKTSEREERIVTYKPIVETEYREKRIEETTYETITEYRDEDYVVRKPVMETQMREENYTVRKPVTEQMIEVQSVTSFKPVLKPQTQMVPAFAQMDAVMAVPDAAQRARLQRLDAGYYTDPVSGASVYRRRGLHWVQPSLAVPATTVAPTLVPQQVNQVEFVPETVETRKPVEFTRYVESVETRKVPVEVQRMIETVETRKIPVTVRKPITKVTIEKVPYTKTTYKEEVTLKKVPYTETTYQKVETVEPYEVEVLKWIPETKEVEVPRTVRRRVDYEMMQDVPRTVMMRVPLDICGNPIAMPAPVYESSVVPTASVPPASTTPSLAADNSGDSSGYGTTLTRRVEPSPSETENGPASTPSVDDSEPVPATSYKGTLQLVRPKTLDETSGSSSSILVPETPPAEEASKTELEKLVRPESESGNPKTMDETSGRIEKEPAEGSPKEAAGDNADGEPNNTQSDGSDSKPNVVPKLDMPEFNPTRTGDENAAERTSDLNPPK